ncbi:MAG: phosphate uptake regulator PhoU [Halobacteriales archaeon]|nr:phosphate uptake regulator PhoU [Halobacteriales archaeon]
MNTRKIQEVGGGTFTVSLPREWARAQSVCQGETVDVFTHLDGTLVIQTHHRETDSTGSVSIPIREEGAERVKQVLLAAYTAGYTDITLDPCRSFTQPQRAAAREAAQTLVGASIATDSEQCIEVRVLVDSEEISVRQLVRQLSFVARSMHREAIAALGEDEAAPRLGDRDDQADRLYAITDRSFSRALSRLDEVDSLGYTRPELFELWSTARDLERIADHAERIGGIANSFDGSVPQDHLTGIQELADSTQTVIERAVNCVVNDSDLGRGYEALTLRSQIRDQVSTLDERLFADSAADYRLARVLDRPATATRWKHR